MIHRKARSKGSSSRDQDRYQELLKLETDPSPAQGEPGTLRQQIRAIELYHEIPAYRRKTERQRRIAWNLCLRLAREGK